MQLIPIGIISAAAILVMTPLFEQPKQQSMNPLVPDGYAPTLTLANWSADYKPYRISTTGSNSTYLGLDSSALMVMGWMGNGSNRGMSMLPELGCRWSKGETVQIGSQTFLVTYRPEPFGIALVGEGQIGVSLELDLLRRGSITEIEPLTHMSKDKFLFDLKSAGWKFQDVPEIDVSEQAASRSDQTRALSNLKQIALGSIMYENDYDDLLPYPQSTAQVASVIRPYIKNDSVWKTGNPNGSHFLFNMSLGGVNSTEIPDPAATVMFYEDEAWPDGRRVVAFSDGHVSLEDQDAWRRSEKTLHLHLKRKAKPFPTNYMPFVPSSQPTPAAAARAP